MEKMESCLDLRLYMEHLTHDIDASDWETEVENMVCVTPNGNIDMSVLVFDSCLENPKLSKWRHAMVWLLVDQYGDEAQVILKHKTDGGE